MTRVVLQGAPDSSPLSHVFDGEELDQSMIDKLLPPLSQLLVPTDQYDEAGRRIVHVRLTETVSTGAVPNADPT